MKIHSQCRALTILSTEPITQMSSESEELSLQNSWLSPASQYKKGQDPITLVKFKHFHLLRSIAKEKSSSSALGKDAWTRGNHGLFFFSSFIPNAKISILWLSVNKIMQIKNLRIKKMYYNLFRHYPLRGWRRNKKYTVKGGKETCEIWF